MSFTPLHGLHAFTVVARHRSFSAAAREMGVSTSALSQAVRQLEERLDLVLLSRTSRSVAPTEIGARLLEESGGPLLRALDGLRAVTRDVGALSGTVRLTVPDLITDLVFAPMLPSFLASFPRIAVQIDIESRSVDLVRQGYDAGVRMETIPKDMIRMRIGGPFRIVVVAAPSYLAKYGEPSKPEDLLRHRCVVMSAPNGATQGRSHPWELESGKRLWKIPVDHVFSCNDRRVRLRMVEAGVGLGYVTDAEVARHVERGTLRIVLEKYAVKMPGSFLYYPSRRQVTPAFGAFLDMVKRQRRI